MYLQHISTINDFEVIEIDLFIVNAKKFKRYRYYLRSKFAAEQFHLLYRRGRKFHGKALTVLNKFKIKEEREM